MLEIYAGRTTYDDDDLFNAFAFNAFAEDSLDVGLNLAYAVSPQLDVYASFAWSDFSEATGGVSFADGNTNATAALGLAYAPMPELQVFGSAWSAEIGMLATDFNAVSLGVAYDLSAVSGINAIVSVEAAAGLQRTERFDNPSRSDFGTVEIGLTFPFGDAPARPLNTNTRPMQGGVYGAAPIAFGLAF